MATTRTQREGRTPARVALDVLQWLWATALSLLLIAVGLALVGGGALFAVVGTQAILDPNHAGHAIAGVLFAVVGLAGMGGGVLTVWKLMPRAVKQLSGRKPPSISGGSSGVFGSFTGSDGSGGCGGDGGGGGSC